jgi:alpha-tubulin suppressor-like RCC1 family protein
MEVSVIDHPPSTAVSPQRAVDPFSRRSLGGAFWSQNRASIDAPDQDEVIEVRATIFGEPDLPLAGGDGSEGFDERPSRGKPATSRLRRLGLAAGAGLVLLAALVLAGRAGPAAESAAPVARIGGVVWAWGGNASGQLGDGTFETRLTPGEVLGLQGVTTVVAGTEHSLARKADGTVWAWGKNNRGQLGDGTTTSRTTPVQVRGLDRVVALAAGDYHSLALGDDGTVWTWGFNGATQLGEEYPLSRLAPQQIAGLDHVVSIASGGNHALALKADGSVWTWGRGAYGALGTGGMIARGTPARVPGLDQVVAIGAGWNHSLAVTRDGSVWAWGWNVGGQVGTGDTTNQLLPIRVEGITGAEAVAGGVYHSLARTADGAVWAWGRHGRPVGSDINSRDAALKPIQVQGLRDAVAIATSAGDSLVLRSDGSIWGWSASFPGNTGYSLLKLPSFPVQVSGLSNVVDLVSSVSHVLAVQNPGR